MALQKHKYQAYAAATQTVAKTRQIVMLYDGVIRLLQQAREAMNEKRIEDRYHLLIKSSDIITGLQSCLDFDNGGEVAPVLFNFYSSIDSRIFSLHRTNNTSDCDLIIADLKQMRDAWHEIDLNESKQSDGNLPSQNVNASATLPANDPNTSLSA